VAQHERQIILITGAGGFVGSHLAKALSKDHDVICVHSLNSANQRGIRCDLSSPQASKEFDNIEFQTIVHCAAAIPFRRGRLDTEDCRRITENLDTQVFNLAESKGAFVIYISTCSLYDHKSTRIKCETDTLFPHTPYLKAKARGEQLALTYQKSSILRLSSPVSKSRFPPSVVANFFAQARKKRCISVWGTGQREQDFIDLDDLNSWLRHLIFHKSQGIFNASSGFSVTMLLLAQLICQKHIGVSIVLNSHSDDIAFARFSNSKITGLTGHFPNSIIQVIQEC
jgi:UDP-glucose 4-epimerase